MKIRIGKYLYARPLLRDDTNHTVCSVHSRDGADLGHIEWYPRWRMYVFAPEFGSVYSYDCLLAMSSFLDELNRKEK